MKRIRYYSDSDYEEVKQILQEAELYDEVWEDRNNLKNKITRDPKSILVAEENNKIVGCVFIVEDGWTAFIWRLAVKKDYQRRGIGLRLMQKAEEIIKEKGMKESAIFVSIKKDSLKEWYQKQNYIKTNDYTFMYKKLK